MMNLNKTVNPIMKRTTPIKDRHTIGYVFGGTVKQRVIEVEKIKREYGCFMTLTSSRKNEKFLDYIRNGQSGDGVIVSLYSRGFVEFVR